MRLAVLRTPEDLRLRAAQARSRGCTVGFVPTMGYLHDGHRSLIHRARQENGFVVVSVFVNPLQFGVEEDFECYPKDTAHDMQVCADADVDVMFIPQVEDIYPDTYPSGFPSGFPSPAAEVPEVPGISTPSNNVSTPTNFVTVSVGGLANMLCNVSRPGHFNAVATVLTKFFLMLGECAVYMGLKDFQQFLVTQSVVAGLFLPIKVVGCPTVREPDGLAVSSRNVYLNSAERAQAPVIYHALNAGARMVCAGETSAHAVERAMMEILLSADLIEVEYVVVRVETDLWLNKHKEASTSKAVTALAGNVRLFVAARFGRTRLIDNLGCSV